MPKPIYLSNFQLDYIRVQLQRISAKTILDASDCKYLAKFLETNRKVFLSESTLKRLFGIVSSNNSASLYTLNLIAKALGFKDWSKLCFSLLDNSFEEINHVLLHNFTNDHLIKTTSFLKSKSLKISSWAEAYQHYIYVTHLIKSRNWEGISDLLSCEINSNDVQQYDYFMFVFQPFCLYSYNGDLELIEFIKSKLKSSENARKYILTGQVFDEKLNLYYGQWVQEIADNTSLEFYPFIKLMLCQKHFMNNEIFNAKNNFNAVKEFALKNQLHPILNGRMAAWDFILNNSEDTLNNVLLNNIDELSKIEIMQFASRLVWQYLDKSIIFKQFEDIKLSEVNLTNSFYQKGRLDCYNLAKSYNYWLQKSDSYIPIIKQVNPYYFHISDISWLQSQYQHLIAV